MSNHGLPTNPLPEFALLVITLPSIHNQSFKCKQSKHKKGSLPILTNQEPPNPSQYRSSTCTCAPGINISYF
uniref:Uncharacterized protein n=1 Tax=Populus trichocarpa TaxID=3694 RepID=A0A2K2ADR7_POPTR